MKRICYFIMFALILCLMITPCYADEVETTEAVIETTAEEVYETVAEGQETATEAIEASQEVVDTQETKEVTEGVVATSFDFTELKNKIADSAIWTMVGSAIVAVITIAGIVASKFSGVSTLIETVKNLLGGKANKEDVEGALNDVKENLTNEFKTAYAQNFDYLAEMLKNQEKALKATQENEQQMYAMLTLFMTNCKISESAKTEILNIAAGVKKYTGEVAEIVEKAQTVINADIEQKENEAPATPVLDEIIEEEYMELG